MNKVGFQSSLVITDVCLQKLHLIDAFNTDYYRVQLYKTMSTLTVVMWVVKR